MQNLKNNFPYVNAISFIDFKPAELVIKSQWLIVFYAKNPLSKKLERFRVCVPAIKSRVERIKIGKLICLKINTKLQNGWLPWHDGKIAGDFKTVEFCEQKFLEATNKDVTNGTKRHDTERSYKSGISMLKKYMATQNHVNKLIIEIDKAYLTNYLDWVFYTNGVSARTYNNYIIFLGVFFSYCLERGFCKHNPAVGLRKKPKEDKQRQILSISDKNNLKIFGKNNKPFYALCLMQYYCFIRPTEITKLKVFDVNLTNKTIQIVAENSKNKKTQTVTIPTAYLETLKNHVGDSASENYLFGHNTFKPNAKILQPKKIYDTWLKFKKDFFINKEVQFYSLKDTGITDLITTGIPAIKVKNQARHSDLKMTETYIYNSNICDEILQNIEFKF